MPKSADLVMFWWHRAAERVRLGQAERFGLITTNSLPQTFNRRVVASALDAKKPLSLLFAIPDHPWYLDGGMAAVRIAMTVGVAGKVEGDLSKVIDNQRTTTQGGDALLPAEKGKIQANLSISANLDQAKPLASNEGLSCRGVVLHGSGIIVSKDEALQLGLGSSPGIEKHIRKYRNGRDLTNRPRDVMVIDLFGLSGTEVRLQFPTLFQHVVQHVKPERDQNRDKAIRENWWIYGRPRPELRQPLEGLPRYISTVETTKHRVFQFLDASILPDAEILTRLVALNRERIAEEGKGIHRYHRPAYQAPKRGISIAPEQAALGIETALPGLGAKKPAWPKSALDRITVVRAVIANQPAPATLDCVGHEFQAPAQRQRP